MQDNILTEYRARLVEFINKRIEQLERYNLQLVNVAEEEVLLRQNARPEQVYILASGLVKVTRTTSADHAFTLGVFDRGETLGEAEVIMGIKHFCTVQTLTNCTLYRIAPDMFLKMLAQEPEFNLLIHQSTASMLLNTSHKVSILSTNRLLYTLLIVLRELSRLNELMISKGLVAEFLGTSVRNLNRLLAQLEDENIVRLKSATIEEINLPLLNKRIHAYETTVQ